jgi:hypothetical protein
LWGEDRTYSWFIRDGFFVRSPVTANGVRISDADRAKYEAAFLGTAKRREGGRGRGDGPPSGEKDAPHDVSSLLTQSRQPQFIDTAYFLRFKFEPGKYGLVGHETLDGHDVLRIEYYPARLFSHEQDAQQRRREEGRGNRGKDQDATVERALNKAALVTLWVEPSGHQILKYTFDHMSLDFLPAAWLLRVRDLTATMTMGEAFPSVWLPHEVYMTVGMLFALGNVDARYHVTYSNYREASTSGRIVGVERR